jgi:hypothetical protein
MLFAEEVFKVGRKLLVIILTGVILALLIPVTTHYYSLEQAFTPDNLIKINYLSH